MATTQQLTVTATYASGPRDVTSEADYTSSDPSVATVSSSGLVTAVGEGSATVTVEFGGLTDTCSVTVTDPLEALTVEPSSATLEVE